LHTLELLSAQKRCTRSQSVETISREVALPADEILVAATTALGRYTGHDPELTDMLKRIVNGARAIKKSIQQVGEELAPNESQPGSTSWRGWEHKRIRVQFRDNDKRVRRSAQFRLAGWGRFDRADNPNDCLWLRSVSFDCHGQAEGLRFVLSKPFPVD
jgi:hypothetical protein